MVLKFLEPVALLQIGNVALFGLNLTLTNTCEISTYMAVRKSLSQTQQKTVTLPSCTIATTSYLTTANTTRFESIMQHIEIVYSSPYDIILTGDFNIDSGQLKINCFEC